MVLAGEAFGAYSIEGRTPIPAKGVEVLVTIGGNNASRPINDNTGTIQMIAQRVEDAVIHPIAGTAEGIPFIILGDFVGCIVNEFIQPSGAIFFSCRSLTFHSVCS